MFANLKRVGHGQYISEAPVGHDRYVVTSTAPMPTAAHELWAALVDELRERSVGSLVQITTSIQGMDDAITALQGILIYRYFDNGFDLMTPVMKILRLPGRIQVEFDARIIDALRGDASHG
ncbi:hypothetical protein [Chitinilyticum aquatile]|uniref:hypothetical protein n=1 Tax=Chitinilyticum aquatile TaxID=362520 RepID=UPI0012DBD91E|nr:hypothetical protein [Chitinilyticum aquatile]